MRLRHHPLIKKFLKIKESLRQQLIDPHVADNGTITVKVFDNLTNVDIEELLKYIYQRKKDYLNKLSRTLNKFKKEYTKINSGKDDIGVDDIYKKRENQIGNLVEELHIELMTLQIHLTTRHNIDMGINNTKYYVYVSNIEFTKLYGTYCGIDQTLSRLEMIE